MTTKQGQVSGAAWDAYRDGPDYTPTDRYPVRQVFDAGYEAGLRASQSPAARPDEDARASLEAACLEGLVLTKHGYRYRPAKGAEAVLAAGWTRADDLTNGDKS